MGWAERRYDTEADARWDLARDEPPSEQQRRMRSPVAYEVFDGVHLETSACVRIGCTPVDEQGDRSQD